MKLTEKNIISLGIFCSLFVVSVILVSTVSEITSYKNPLALYIGQGVYKDATIGARTADIDLKFNAFNTVSRNLSGSSSVSMYVRRFSNPSKALIESAKKYQEEIKSIPEVEIRFSHYQSNKDIKGYLEQGRNKQSIKLRYDRIAGVMFGEGEFTWSANALISSFWYPFDKYLLYVNPQILHPDKNNTYINYIDNIEQINLEMQVPNLRMVAERNLVSTSEKRDSKNPSIVTLERNPSDPYIIKLDRPSPLQVISIFLCILSIFWLGYLIWFADTESHVGGILAFFVGIWGIRNTLLGNLYIFPSFLDYFTITLSLIAVIVVIFKWWIKIFSTNTKECKYCLSKIPVKASKCPHCLSQFISDADVTAQAMVDE
jgi:hypothetical protein